MRRALVLRLAVVALTCVLLWAGVLWLLPASGVVRANPGSLFVTVTGTGTACSQAQPCGLQAALVRADYGDEIYVAAGTYTGSGAAVVTLTNSIGLYGGWNGAASGAVVRDPVANRSILDGQGARRVVFAAPGIAFTVDGFTIQHGNATAGPDPCCGGGIYSYGAWPWITNNTIAGNTACTASSGYYAQGGGVYVDSAAGAPLIQGNQVLGNVGGAAADGAGGGLLVRVSPKAEVLDNVVLDNTASITNGSGVGGGVAVIQCDGATVLRNTLESNRGSTGSFTNNGSGAGLYLANSTGVVVKNNRIRNNIASVSGPGYGGGVAAYGSDELLAANNLVESNTAAAHPGAGGLGGGLLVEWCLNVDISSNRVLGNTAEPIGGQGGGLWIENNSTFTMTNNIVAGNRADFRGGGLALAANSTERVIGSLFHNTFVANNAGSDEGRVAIFITSDWVDLGLVNNLLAIHSYGVCAIGGTATLNRTLFFGNTSADVCPWGTVVNIGPITGLDPLLDPAYHLRPGSPAIDAGMNAGVTSDIDGDPRPLGLGYDIGADEYAQRRLVYLPVVLKRR